MGPCPSIYDINLLGPLSLQQIVFWDETHKKVLIGTEGAGSTKIQYRFPRDESGRLDALGELGQEKHYVKVKFEGESR